MAKDKAEDMVPVKEAILQAEEVRGINPDQDMHHPDRVLKEDKCLSPEDFLN
jgi:hypothetical protein